MALTSARAIHKRVAALQVLSSAAAGRDKYIQFVFENQSSKLVNSILVGFALIAMTAMCRMPPGQKAVHGRFPTEASEAHQESVRHDPSPRRTVRT